MMAVGASEEFLTEVQQLALQIDQTNDAQEMSKDARMEETQERVVTLNKLFKGLQCLEKVAPYVFPAKSVQLTFFKVPVYKPPLREIAEDENPEATHIEMPPETTGPEDTTDNTAPEENIDETPPEAAE